MPADQTAETTAQQTTTTTELAVADATAAQQSAQSATADKTFTQADVDRIVKQRLERAESKAQEVAQKAAADAEAKALAEQGKFKELYEKLQADNAAATQRIKDMEMTSLRRDVASKLGLPAGLADRLRGDTAEALEADAKALLEAMPKAAAPNINASAGAGLTDAQITKAQANELAAIYGVNPKYLQ